jgi:hypothetical protein
MRSFFLEVIISSPNETHIKKICAQSVCTILWLLSDTKYNHIPETQYLYGFKKTQHFRGTNKVQKTLKKIIEDLIQLVVLV